MKLTTNSYGYILGCLGSSAQLTELGILMGEHLVVWGTDIDVPALPIVGGSSTLKAGENLW